MEGASCLPAPGTRSVRSSADGGESRPITPPSGVPVTGYGPDMSPDGTKIAYIRVVGQRNRWGVSVMRADGTGRRVLVSPARLNRLSGKLPVDELADVCWSPNGSRLAFTAASGHAYQSWGVHRQRRWFQAAPGDLADSGNLGGGLVAGRHADRQLR